MAEPGALSGLTNEDPQTYTYNVYQTESAAPDMDLTQLQDIYGTESMPVFQWVRTIQTGERTYTPSNPVDQEMLNRYQETVGDQTPPGYMTPEEIRKQAIGDVASSAATYVGTNVGAALTDPYYMNLGTLEKTGKGLASSIGFDTASESAAASASRGQQLLKLDAIPKGKIYYPDIADRVTAEATGNLDLYNKLKGTEGASKIGGLKGPTVYSEDAVREAIKEVGGSLPAADINPALPQPSYLEGVGNRLYGEGAKQNWSSAGMGGVFNFGVQLAMGKDPEKAAKSAGASAIGTALGNALLPGLGGVIGGTLGGILGGRVICNELCRQGFMTRKQVVLDYRFTRDYLTPQHVNGYHIWAVSVVRNMRKGKGVKLWKHIATHRANEIEYIYGLRDKGDLLGKIYRKILEPTCWLIGAFCSQSDWSVLYETKEC